jgi:hypothetical protein
MAGSSTETFPTPSDGTYGVGNVKVEKDIDMKEEEEVKKGMGSEKDIKDEDGMYSEEEQEELEDICTKEEEEVDMQDAVSYWDFVEGGGGEIVIRREVCE